MPDKLSKARKLYACLEKVADSKDDDQTYDIVKKKFKRFFKKKISDVLFQTPLLHGHITDADREKKSTEEPKEDVPINGESVLLRALLIPTISCSEKFTSVDYIINKLIDHVPEMILHNNKYTNEITGKVYSSITPLHVAILKEDSKLLYRAGHMLTKKGDKLEHVIDKINGIDANEEKYQNTLMMAGTPLGVATLTCNVEIFCLILSHFHSELTVVNEKGDNVVHSLIKCTHRNPDPLYKEKSKSMLNFILNMKWRECIKGKPGAAREETRLLLMMKNEEKLTPLQLAAKREQNELFEIILQHEVYCLKDSVDCTHNVKYDITEIETLALEAEDSNDKHEHLQTGRHESILEYVALQDTESAFRFADFLPVRKVIRAKWQYYRYLFYGWFAFHLVFISLLTVVALRRSELVSAPDNSANQTLRQTKLFLDIS
ncbi:uncharacterized protein LOC128546864 [Mercenaria mercenaria]|uniref:uncharacterized protein LOC128546864 n=1 Tax=Mercenaria mercenaria TaxID=6596 RepID=UPI00234E771A|nr:uncharacterized protein LOC128546864 [Mercenaria mercenaria]